MKPYDLLVERALGQQGEVVDSEGLFGGPLEGVHTGESVVTSYTGVSFTYYVGKGATGYIEEEDEEAWKTAVREENRAEMSRAYPFEFAFPCGNVVHYESLDALPMEDVPCPCGDPAHWFVKYKYEGSKIGT